MFLRLKNKFENNDVLFFVNHQTNMKKSIKLAF